MCYTKNRNYCFTLNNYTDEEINHLKESAEMGKYVFICWGYETSQDTNEEDGFIKKGTPHLQGYMEFKNARYLNGIKKDPGCYRMHLEPRADKSTKLLAVTYCAKLLIEEVYLESKKAEILKNDPKANIRIVSADEKAEMKTLFENEGNGKISLENEKILASLLIKPSEKTTLDYGRFDLKWRKSILLPYQDKYFEAGNWQHGLKPGKRNDIFIAKDIVASGGGMREVLESVNSYQAARMAQLMLTHINPTRNWKTKVYWFWGPTGKGKSETAWAMCREDGVEPWMSSNNLQWFDGYDRHSHVILDDFRGNQSTFSFLLKLTDKYPLRVQVKGGFVDWCPKVIFITAPDKPEICYEGQDDEKLDQLLRRIEETIEFK